jgi:hypothetical protein
MVRGHSFEKVFAVVASKLVVLVNVHVLLQVLLDLLVGGAGSDARGSVFLVEA